MKKVSEERMKLRIEYSRETDLIFSDNIPAYADWLEERLALSQHDINVGLLSVSYLMEKHPEINESEAKKLLEFCEKHTIRYKECYGDGRIMYPKWKESNRD